MPELEEVFRVATQKVRRDPGAMDRQLEKQRRAGRNRKLGALAVVAVVIAAAGAAVAVIGGNPEGAPASVGPSVSPSPVVFPTGSVTSSMVDLDTGAVTPLPNLLAGADAYAVSPDRAQVAFTASQALYVGNIDGTNIHQVSPIGVDAYGGQWSPDGTKLVYQQRNANTIRLGNLFVLDVTTDARPPNRRLFLNAIRVRDLPKPRAIGMTAKRFAVPSCCRLNAIHDPSGDQDGFVAPAPSGRATAQIDTRSPLPRLAAERHAVGLGKLPAPSFPSCRGVRTRAATIPVADPLAGPDTDDRWRPPRFITRGVAMSTSPTR